jgi:hypothetical protein
MKKKPPTTEPSVRWEEITPAMATSYLEKNVSNRVVRKGTVAADARDMKLGNWVPTHQGIGFNDRGELIDGQHRLCAIVSSGVTIRTLVTRGIPAESGEMRTMDAVDRGAVRSVADQLQLQHGYRNAAQVAGCGSTIAGLILQKWIGRITVPQMLKVLEIYGRHIEPIIQVTNRSKIKVFRRAAVNGPLALARVVAPQRLDDFTEQLESGAGLGAESPILLLRNHLFTAGSVTTSDSRELAKLTLNCAHRFVLGEPMGRLNFTTVGLRYFADRQKDNLTKIAQVFQGVVATFEETAAPKRERNAAVPPTQPGRVVRACDIKLTPLAESLIRGKEMSDRANRRAEAT